LSHLLAVLRWPEAHERHVCPMSAFEGEADMAAKNVNFG
jgi:hypothetical protein